MELPASIRLKANFDSNKLFQDLETAQKQFRSAPQAGAYHDGSWTGIALKAINGDYKNTLAISSTNVEYTEVIEHCPYFKEILESLPFPVGVTRILFLPPGKKIGTHTDKGFSWAKGHVRLHIPIVTDPKVHFQIGEESVHWPAGQLWFGDFNQPHWLHNQSDVVRVHIVMDCFITNELLSLFPQDTLEKIRAATPIKTFDHWGNSTKIINPDTYTGFFKAPKTLSSIPLYGSIIATNSTLEMSLFGLPFSYRYKEVDTNTFQGLNSELSFYASGDKTTFHLKLNADKKVHIGIVIKSLPHTARLYSAFQTLLVKGILGAVMGALKLSRFTKRVFKLA